MDSPRQSRALEFGHFPRNSLWEAKPQGWQGVAGGRSGQRGNDHRKTASGGSSTPAGCQNLGDMTPETTRPAVLTASTWGRIGLRAFPAAPGVPVRTSAGDDAPPVRRYTPHHLQAVISRVHGRNVPAQFSGVTPISSRLDSDGSGTPAGVQNFSCAVVRRWPPPGTLDRKSGV